MCSISFPAMCASLQCNNFLQNQIHIFFLKNLRVSTHHRSDGFVFLSSGCVKLRACCQERDKPCIQFIIFNSPIEQFGEYLPRKGKQIMLKVKSVIKTKINTYVDIDNHIKKICLICKMQYVNK